METIRLWINNHLPWLKVSSVQVQLIDVIEILILSFLVYSVLVWIKRSRAWTLLKGMLLIGFFIALIYLFKMDTLMFIIGRGLNLLIMAAIIIFQPELRKVLEQLGEKEFISNLLPASNAKDVEQLFSDRTVYEIVRATMEMAKVKTGALMVIEKNEMLDEYEKTGIALDAVISSQLIINIFEKNTPLHDGAVLMKGDKIVSATCYLPLSDNLSLEKDLGTRHRAAVGISEVTDSMTIVVSEETGKISIAQKGELTRNLSEEMLRARLIKLQNKMVDPKKRMNRKILTGGREKLKATKGTNRNEA